jgi:hypothetical protein
MTKSLLRLYQKYGIRTPETVAAFREWRASEQNQIPDPTKKRKPRKPKRKLKSRSVRAIPTAFESSRRKH